MEMDDNIEQASTPESRRSRLTREQLIAVGSILMAELFERLTFYSIFGNLVLFCTSSLNFSNDDAYVIALLYEGTAYFFPVLGGFVSDVWFGKFRTIVGSCMLYIHGFILVLGAAWERQKMDVTGEDYRLSQTGRKIYFFTGLFFIAIGSGGFKANIGAYGAQQVADLGPDAVKSFFNWYFWFTNAGAVITFSGVAYVQQEMGFGYSFLLSFISIILALSVFVAAKSKYVRKLITQRGNILGSSIGIWMQSCSECQRPTLNHQRRGNGGNNTVSGVKADVRVLSVFGLFILSGISYSQIDTSLFLQSGRMNISIKDAKLPAAVLGILPALIVVLILIPITDLGVYPLLAKFGISLTHLQRIGIGIIFSACAMFFGGVIEIIRKNDIAEHGYIEQTLLHSNINASKISIFAQVPEFVLMGFSGILVHITGLEYTYTQAPWFMQGLCIGLFMMTGGLGNYLALLIKGIVKLWRKDDASDWFPEEPNNGHLEYFLFLLGALTALGLIVFIVIIRWYESRKGKVTENEEPEPEVVSVVEYDNRACDRERSLEDMQSTAL